MMGALNLGRGTVVDVVLSVRLWRKIFLAIGLRAQGFGFALGEWRLGLATRLAQCLATVALTVLSGKNACI